MFALPSLLFTCISHFLYPSTDRFLLAVPCFKFVCVAYFLHPLIQQECAFLSPFLSEARGGKRGIACVAPPCFSVAVLFFLPPLVELPVSVVYLTYSRCWVYFPLQGVVCLRAALAQREGQTEGLLALLVVVVLLLFLLLCC